MNDERHPWIQNIVDEIANTSSLLAILQITAERGEILVGMLTNDGASMVWSSVPSTGDETVSWGKNARQFLKEHNPQECARVGLFLPNSPLILFSITQDDISSLRFPTTSPALRFPTTSPVVQARIDKAAQKRHRRAQRNRRILANIPSNE